MSGLDEGDEDTRAMVLAIHARGSNSPSVRANFKCPVPRCGRTFVHHYDLRSHIRTHSQGPSSQTLQLLPSPRATSETSSNHSNQSSRESLHRQRIEGPPLSDPWPSSESQVESHPIANDGWSQQTTYPTHSLATLSLGKSDGAIVTSSRSSYSPAIQHETMGGPGVFTGVTPPLPEIPPISERGSNDENMGPENEIVSITQGTKRSLEDDCDQTDGEQGGNPKRGKVIHHDYADVLPNHVELSFPKEYSANSATHGIGADDPTSDTVMIQSKELSCEDMFRHLVSHGCADLSSVVDPEKYSAGLIQGGAFGDIWKGKLYDGTEVAIKVWRFNSIPKDDVKPMKRAMREIYHWSKAKHENIQELMGVIMFQGRLGMVSLWMEYGNLRDYLGKHPNANRLSLGIQVAAGLSYLHDQNMVHGDLKAVNILVSRERVAKISDFDHSILSECTLVFSETTNAGGGTLRWMAPELLLSSDEEDSPPAPRNKLSDVYALGMTLLEIITGDVPYSEYKREQGVYRALDKGRVPNRPAALLGASEWEPGTWSLLLECWDHDPLVRPSSAQVHERLIAIENQT